MSYRFTVVSNGRTIGTIKAKTLRLAYRLARCRFGLDIDVIE